MNPKKKAINMTEGPILKTLLTFCLPIFLGSVFQQLYNMVDSIVVGKYVSADALAAVGTSSPLTMCLVNLMMGFSTGSSIVASQYIGAHKRDKIKPTISTTLILLVSIALVLTAGALIFSRQIMAAINVPENIIDQSLTYFRIFCSGILFMALYNFFAAFLRSMGDSTTPLMFLILSSLLNIAGDLLFVLVFHQGVAGVAYATVIAQGLSVVLCVLYVRKNNSYFIFHKGEFRFDRSLSKSVIRLGLPSCLQNGLSSLGMIAVQGLINSFGSVNIAAYTAANKMEMLCNLPTQSMSQGMSLYVGQNIGAGNEKRAKQGLFRGMAVSLSIALLLMICIYTFGPKLMTLFVSEGDTAVIETGAAFMRIWAPLILIHSTGQLMISFLRGAGDSIASLISMCLDLGTRTLMAYVFARGLSMGFMGIAWSIPCGWAAATIFALVCFLSGRWRKKAVVRKE